MSKRKRSVVDGVLRFRSEPFFRLDKLQMSDDDVDQFRNLTTKSLHTPDHEFQMLLKRITQNNSVRLVSQSISGSDANNMIFDVLVNMKNKDPMCIVFDKLWLAQRGLLYAYSSMQCHYKRHTNSCIQVKAPWIPTDGTLDIITSKRELNADEKACLQEISDLKSTHPNIGAVIVEIMTSSAEFCLSGSFLIGLQQTCRQHQIVLLVDEIMTFGITNKPFLFQHIVDFTPNLVSVGKAFGMEGLLQFKAHSKRYRYRTHRPEYITSPFNYGATLKARLYWKYISSNNLLLSSYQVSLQLRRQFEDYKLGGIGTIIRIPNHVSLTGVNVSFQRLFVPFDARLRDYQTVRFIMFPF